MPTLEDRLLTLAMQARRAGLLDLTRQPQTREAQDKRNRIVADLIAQAPDLADEIRVLCRALDCLVIAPENDAASLAIMVAAAEGVPQSKAQAAAEVAVLMSGANTQQPPIAPDKLSKLAEGLLGPPRSPAAPPAAPRWTDPPAPEPMPPWQPPASPVARQQPWQQPWFFAVIAALVVVAAFAYFQPWSHDVEQIADGPEIGMVKDNLRPGGPLLSLDQTALPLLPVERAASGAFGVGFSLVSARGPVEGLLVLPAGGWDRGEASLIGQRSDAASVGTGRFMRNPAGMVPMRILKPAWKEDGLDAGPVCVLIGGQPGAPDVDLHGAKMCLADGACQQPVGCGTIP